MTESRPPEDSFALLTPLVHYLVAAKSVTVEQAAEHFAVPPSRIRRAVRLLSLTGVPNSWGDPTMFDFDFDAFENEDRVEIRYLPAFERATVKLSPREAAAIVAGLERLRQIAVDDADRIDALLGRVRQATVARHLTVAAQPAAADETVRTARRAIEQGHALSFLYRKPSETEEQRRVIPVRLEIHDEVTLVAAFDLDREAMRTFRLDRIREAVLTTRPEHAHFIEDRERGISETITVHTTPSAALALASYASSSEPAEDGGRILTIEAWDTGAVLRAIMATGGEAKVIAPQRAVLAIHELARAAMG